MRDLRLVGCRLGRRRATVTTYLEKLKLPRGRTRAERDQAVRALLNPVVRFLARARVSPNDLTTAGLVGALAVAGLVLWRHWIAAGIVFVVAIVLDSLDGALARATGRTSRFGAFLDSTFDRLGEGLVLGAIGVTLAEDGQRVAVGACFLALTASFLVSYTRARAEGLGVPGTEGGLMRRPERLVLTAMAIFLAPVGRALEVLIIILAALSLVTVGQRLWHVWRELRRPVPPEKEHPES